MNPIGLVLLILLVVSFAAMFTKVGRAAFGAMVLMCLMVLPLGLLR